MADQYLPSSPSARTGTDNRWKPWEVDAELANAKMVDTLMSMYGRPGIVSKDFVIWRGILNGLNHRSRVTEEEKVIDPGNPTYLDLSMLLSVFDGVFDDTVNISGSLFEKSWQYLMKPKVIIQGVPPTGSFQEEEKQSVLDRIRGWVGGGKDESGNK